MKVPIAIAAAGAAATLALAPTTSQARSLHEQHGASRALSIATAKAVTVQPDGKIVAGGMRGGAGKKDGPAGAGGLGFGRRHTERRPQPQVREGRGGAQRL